MVDFHLCMVFAVLLVSKNGLDITLVGYTMMSHKKGAFVPIPGKTLGKFPWKRKIPLQRKGGPKTKFLRRFFYAVRRPPIRPPKKNFS